MKIEIGVGLLLAAITVVCGQTPSFDVASIKPAPPVTTEQMLARTAHIGMKVDGARVDIGSASLKNLIIQAYHVESYQVAGPDWLETYRQNFDILAKMPDGATREQIPEMIQQLLVERFKLAAHRESREYQVYALVAGKNGTKIKAAPSGAAFAFTTSVNPDGTIHSQQTVTMAMFAQFLTPYVDRPVLDMTEMQGTYEIGMDVSRQSRTDPGFGSEFFAAVQQLGLKLEPRKMARETIVVDRLEKMPTDN